MRDEGALRRFVEGGFARLDVALVVGVRRPLALVDRVRPPALDDGGCAPLALD